MHKNFGLHSVNDDVIFNYCFYFPLLKDVYKRQELTSAFATIANQGVYTEPIFFTKIIDRNGKVLINNEPETRRVLKDVYKRQVLHCLFETLHTWTQVCTTAIFSSCGIYHKAL